MSQKAAALTCLEAILEGGEELPPVMLIWDVLCMDMLSASSLAYATQG